MVLPNSDRPTTMYDSFLCSRAHELVPCRNVPIWVVVDSLRIANSESMKKLVIPHWGGVDPISLKP